MEAIRGTRTSPIASSVYRHGALMDCQLAHAMDGLYVLLFHGLDGHEVHRWAAGGIDDGLRIVAIILVGPKRRDVLRADERFNAHFPKASGPVVRRAACSWSCANYSNQAIRQVADIHLLHIDDRLGP